MARIAFATSFFAFAFCALPFDMLLHAVTSPADRVTGLPGFVRILAIARVVIDKAHRLC
jgi:hypothetical protein